MPLGFKTFMSSFILYFISPNKFTGVSSLLFLAILELPSFTNLKKHCISTILDQETTVLAILIHGLRSIQKD